MFNSKALKDFPKRFMSLPCGCPDECYKECGFIGKVFHYIAYFFLFKIYYKIESHYHRTSERLSRSIAYARFGWLNYDFDMACAWDLFDFKLRRLYKCLVNGNAVQEPEDMKALRELIKIVRRLSCDRYENIYYRQHEKRWGKLQTRTEPWIQNGKNMGSSWHSWREKCPEDASEELKAREINDMKCCWENADKDRIRDLERMKEILVKHGQNFWD